MSKIDKTLLREFRADIMRRATHDFGTISNLRSECIRLNKVLKKRTLMLIVIAAALSVIMFSVGIYIGRSLHF